MTDTTVVYEIDVPLLKGKPPLTANMRLHRMQEHQRTKHVRHTVAWHATSAAIPACAHITVRLHYHAGDNRKRDASNLYPTSKAAIDGIRDAGIVPDDDGRYVTEINPIIEPAEHGQPRRLWLTVEVTTP